MRIGFFVLLFANLAFLAWSQWIDAPQPAPANEAYTKLPHLQLMNESPATPTARPSSGNARKTALEEPPPPPVASCVSVGPFDDQTSATRGASQLREKGLTPRQRVQPAEVSKGYWVFIGGLKTDRDVAQVLRTLEQSHVEDAHVMPDTGDVRQVSVGLFSDKDRADRRALAIQKLGLQPEVAERKLPTTVFWMDVDVPAGGPSLQDVSLKASSGAGSTPKGDSGGPHAIQVTACPVSPSPDNAAPQTPASAPPFRTKVAGASQVP